jgi:hypothetical protein
MKIRFTTPTQLLDNTVQESTLLEMQIDNTHKIPSDRYDCAPFQQWIEVYCPKEEQLEIHFDYFHAAMVSFIEWIKQNFTITTTYNSSLPEIDHLKALLNTAEEKKEAFDFTTERETLLRKCQDEKITLQEFIIDYKNLVEKAVPGLDEENIREMIGAELELIRTGNTTLQNNNPTGTAANAQAENSNKLGAGKSALKFDFEAEKKKLVQALENQTIDKAMFNKKFLQLLDAGAGVDDDMKKKLQARTKRRLEDTLDNQLASLQPSNANPTPSFLKPQTKNDSKLFLKKFKSKRSKSLKGGCCFGLFKTSNLKEDYLDDSQAILDHAKKGRFFGFFDNRTCSILKKMNVLDAKGELVDDNLYQLKRNNK